MAPINTTTADGGGPLERRVLEEAARWYVRLHGDEPAQPNAREAQSWQRWLDEAPAHRRAWERVRHLQARMGRVPADIALPTLQARTGMVSRRGALKTFGLVLGVGTAGAMGWRLLHHE